MARYIDAEKLKEQLQDFSKWCRDGRKQGVDFVLDCPLPNMPTADVQEVKHGYWKEDEETGNLQCSECGHLTREILWYPVKTERGTTHRAVNPAYCSKCGTKMDEPTEHIHE